MSATEVVRITSVARGHARKSLARLEGHIARGSIKGIKQEMKFLDALERNAAKQAARVTGVPYKPTTNSLGIRAANALGGGAGSPQYIKSSVLADFSDSTMAPARILEAGKPWVWNANATACAACLLEHGTVYPAAAIFTPAHKSCMCIPTNALELVRPLSDSELAGQLIKRGGRDARLAQQFLNGDLKRAEMALRLPNGAKVQRNTVPGLQSKSPPHKWSKNEVQVLDELGPLAKKPVVVKHFRETYPNFKGSDQSIWAKHQRTHDILGKKKVTKVGGPSPTKVADIPGVYQDPFKVPKGVTKQVTDTYVDANIYRKQLWSNGSSVYEGSFASKAEFELGLRARYNAKNIKIVHTEKLANGKWRAVVRHLDVEKQLKTGSQGKLWPKPKPTTKVAPKPGPAQAPIPKPPTPQPPVPELPTSFKTKKTFKDSEYVQITGDEAGTLGLDLGQGTRVVQLGEYTGDRILLTDDVLKMLSDIDSNFILKNKAVKKIQFQYGSIEGAPGAAGYFNNGTVFVRLDGVHGAQASKTLAHELTHGFLKSKPGRAIADDFVGVFDDMMTNWDTLSDEARSVLQYARSKVGTNKALAREEGLADLWSLYLTGEKAMIKELGLEAAFKDAARRLSYVPIKKRTAKQALSDWFYKVGEVRTGTPNFERLEAASNAWFSKLNLAQKAYIRDYTNTQASVWNKALGSGQGHYGVNSEILEKILKASPQSEFVYSWRAVPRGKDMQAFIRQLKEAAAKGGKGEIQHPTFASTTTKPGSYGNLSSSNNIIIEFKSKSGQFIKQGSGYKNENEFLIAANTRFRVIGTEKVTFTSQGYTVESTVYKLEEIL